MPTESEGGRRYRIHWRRLTIYKGGLERGFRDMCMVEIKTWFGWIPIEGAQWYDDEKDALEEIERHRKPVPKDRYL